MIEKKKILVIADDFTGAAEIGGIGLRNGLRVAIETEPIYSEENDIIVIATDTRSMSKQEATLHISKLTKELMQFNPLFIYKKIDSVLRGNISEELVTQMKVTGKKRAIIVAANPVFKRIIKDGNYYIDDVPLNETCFSNDSQFPIQSNEVLKLLNPVEGYPIINLKPDDPLPEKGLIIGDVESLDDLQKWTLKYSEDILFAGAFGFFNSLLKSLNYTDRNNQKLDKPFGTPALFIMGSTYPKNERIIARMIEMGHHHSNMPKEIYCNENFDSELLNAWVYEIVTKINEKQKVIVSCIHKKPRQKDNSFRIKKIIAELVKRVFEEVKIQEILIEGGSTTSEILDNLGIKKLTPIQELDTGVIRMKVDLIPDLYLTTKPGSYQWPEKVWMNDESLTRIELND